MKIGFLGMSGIRAHDAKLLELGLTLPGFVERSKQIAALPSLGLLSLAACTPPGHDLAYFEAPRDGDESAELYDCDLVAISTLTAQAFEAYAIADRLRDAEARGQAGPEGQADSAARFTSDAVRRLFRDVAKAVLEERNFENRMLKGYIKDWPAEERA